MKFGRNPNSPVSTGASNDVTAIVPIKGRTVVYAIEAGNLDVYDGSDNFTKTIDLQGLLSDMKPGD